MALAWLDNVSLSTWVLGTFCVIQLTVWIWLWMREGEPKDLRILATLALVGGIVFVSLVNPSHVAADSIPGDMDSPVQIEELKRFVPNPDHIRAFPGTVNQAKTLKLALQLLYAVSLCGIMHAIVKKQPALIEPICWLVLVHGAVVGLVALYFKNAGSELLLGRFETTNPRFYGPFRYNNYWAAWNILTTSAAVGLLFSSIRNRGYLKLVLCLIGIAVLLLCALNSASRSAILVSSLLILYAAVEGLIWIVFRFGWLGPKLNLVKLGIYGAITGFLLFATIAVAITSTWENWATREFAEKQSGRFKDTIGQMIALREGHLPDLRPAMARDAVKMAIAKPIWGWGLGSYAYAFPLFAGPEFMEDRFHRQTNNYGKLIRPRHAHNDWVQYWAELGTVGFLALLWSIFLFLRPTLQQVSWIETFPYTRPLLAGVSTLAIMALWDFPLYNLSVLSLLAIILALIASCPSANQNPE